MTSFFTTKKLLTLIILIICGFTLQAQDWNQVIKTASSTRYSKSSAGRLAGDNFGVSVSVDGDYAVVGSCFENEDASGSNTLTGAGSAQIFKNTNGVWQLVKKIVASDRSMRANFGFSVAISGSTVVVGANKAGFAYIFSKDQGGTDNWGQVKKIVSLDWAARDNFGISVAINGSTVIVGASDDDSAAGSAYIFGKDQGGMDNWGQAKKIVASDMATNNLFGISVAISGSTVVVGAYLESEDANNANTLSAAGSAYIFSKDQGGMDNWGQVKKIVASDRVVNDRFGYSVAISGSIVVVGAVFEDDGTSNADAGSAYIFSKDQGGTDNWGEVKKIIASDRAKDDNFGNSVAISGNMVVVGAALEDEDASNANTLAFAGSAYIFNKDQGGTDNWGQVKKIVPSDRATDDRFGNSVAISGDKVVVGAYAKDEDMSSANAQPDAGATYIFSKDQGGTDNWGQSQKIVFVDYVANQYYGRSVAIDGDYAVVGANQDYNDATGSNFLLNAGSVYILKNINGTWTEIKKIVASDRAKDDNFGNSVAISGSTVVVGAYFEDEDASNMNTKSKAGSAYIFSKDQGGTDNWGQVKKIVASDRAASDYFGYSVAISGSTVVVGAYADDSNTGSTYIFSKDQGGSDNWGQVKEIVASDKAAYDYFGFSVAISGSTVVVGAAIEDEDASNANTLASAGSAYIFSKDQGGADNWGQVKKIVASDRAMGDYFGYSVTISGSTVVVGAYFKDDGTSNRDAGAAYIFSKDQGGTNNWGQVKKIVASDRASSDYFGYSVAISGSTVVIGAYQEDHDASGANTLSAAGSAYIFSKDQGGTNNWGQVKKIVASDRAANDYFGSSVTISDSTVIAGAYLEDENAMGGESLSNTGSAYFFKLTCSNTIQIAGSNNAISNTISGATSVYGSSCQLLATVNPLGANPVSGNFMTKLWIESTQPTDMVKRHYEITPDNNPNTATGRVTLYYTQAEFNDFNTMSATDLPSGTSDAAGKANLRILKISGTSNDGTGSMASYTGAQTTIDPADTDIVWNATTNMWEVSFDVTGFSGFFVQATSTVLPLSMTHFNAKPDGKDALVTWQTQDEKNHSHYEVERSIDAKGFEYIGMVKGQGLATSMDYNWVDKGIGNQAKLVYYRLKMMDNDGSFSYSKTVSVNFEGKNSKVLSVYPNPATASVVVEYPLSTQAEIMILNTTGQVIKQMQTESNFTTLNLQDLPSGLYFIRLNTDGVSLMKKVVKE